MARALSLAQLLSGLSFNLKKSCQALSKVVLVDTRDLLVPRLENRDFSLHPCAGPLILFADES